MRAAGERRSKYNKDICARKGKAKACSVTPLPKMRRWLRWSPQRHLRMHALSHAVSTLKITNTISGAIRVSFEKCGYCYYCVCENYATLLQFTLYSIGDDVDYSFQNNFMSMMTFIH